MHVDGYTLYCGSAAKARGYLSGRQETNSTGCQLPVPAPAPATAEQIPIVPTLLHRIARIVEDGNLMITTSTWPCHDAELPAVTDTIFRDLTHLQKPTL